LACSTGSARDRSLVPGADERAAHPRDPIHRPRLVPHDQRVRRRLTPPPVQDAAALGEPLGVEQPHQRRRLDNLVRPRELGGEACRPDVGERHPPDGRRRDVKRRPADLERGERVPGQLTIDDALDPPEQLALPFDVVTAGSAQGLGPALVEEVGGALHPVAGGVDDALLGSAGDGCP
jgi:hypothetical protein